ncbi:hypothetical protein ACO0LF_00355 [Undibacterium sp. Di27W]|uniref:hypothetical protein n=1 Tax=Undibacterium sp. Di27W TaxID=3413036 RepID=UPI003BF0C2E6
MAVLLRIFVFILFFSYWPDTAFSQPDKASAPTMPTASGMTLETVMQRYLAALGDINKMQIRRIKMRVTGIAPFAIPITIESKRPNLVRKDMQLKEYAQVASYDGKDAWMIDTFLPSGMQAVDVPQKELADLLQESYFDGALVEAYKQGFPLRYAGIERHDGRTVHVLKLKLPGTNELTIHLDSKSFLEITHIQKVLINGRMSELTVRSHDYRKQGDSMTPYRFDFVSKGENYSGSMVVDSVENNPVIATSRFQRPAAKTATH